MSYRLRLCTFNIENLFTRFDFDAFTVKRDRNYLPPIVNFLAQYGEGDLSKFDDFKQLLKTATVAQDDDKRQHTALAIAELDADIYCLQEVDNIEALQRFFDYYVKKIGVDPYPNFILHEGNDQRGIDVAAVTRDIRPTYSRSHAFLTKGDLKKLPGGSELLAQFPKTDDVKGGRVFSRDSLELEVVLPDGQRVTIFNCHFKSMSGGRGGSMGKRQLEACAVRTLISNKFDDPATALWAVVGDLNDYRAVIKLAADGSETLDPLADNAPSGVDPLLKDGFGQNLLELIPDEFDRWTHYYAGQKHKTQIDYVIASPALAAKVNGTPTILRSGQPLRVPNSSQFPRYPRVGWDRPKASDHCPVLVEFQI